MLTLLLLGQGATAESVLNRYEQFLKKNDSLSVVVKGRVNLRSFGTGIIKIDRPNRLSFTVNLPEGETAFTLNEKAGLEVDRAHQIYAQYPRFNQIYVPQFRLGTVLNFAAPSSLINGNLRGLMPSGAALQLTPKAKVNGVVADLVTGKGQTQAGTVEIKVWIDAGGRLIKYVSVHTTQMGALTVEQNLSDYVSNPTFPASAFATDLPLGYVPYELSRADTGLQQAEPMPNVSLKAANTGQAATLSSLTTGKNTMVLVTDPDYPSNEALLKSIRDVSAKVPDFRLVVVSMRKDPSSAKRIGVSNAYYDPTGDEIDKLAVPGAPTMFLVDKKGKLAQMFFGFDGHWEGLDQVIEILKRAN